jgi:hypothetical protein
MRPRPSPLPVVPIGRLPGRIGHSSRYQSGTTTSRQLEYANEKAEILRALTPVPAN